MPSPYHAPYDVTQPFGCTGYPAEPAYNGCEHFHLGIDLVGPSPYCPIYPVMAGAVYAAGTDTDGANYVIIQSPGLFHAYWHLSAINCRAGQQVDTTTYIGNQGSSGNSNAPHLHLQIMRADRYGRGLNSTGTPIDPLPFLQDTAQGGADDMTDQDIILNALVATQHIDPATYPQAALDGHVARLRAGTPLSTLIAEFIRDGGWLDEAGYNLSALAMYAEAKGMTNPKDYAYARWTGGDTFHMVITGDLRADRDAALAQAETNKKLTDQIADNITTIGRLQDQLGQAQKPDPLPDTRTWAQLITDGIKKLYHQTKGT